MEWKDVPQRSGDGSYVGRYRLRDRLGVGGMGSVWRADDDELGTQVAIKQVNVPIDDGDPRVARDPARNEESLRRARREALHAAQLRGHPHVATVLDVVQHEGLPWIVMEYVPGATDLGKVIRDEPRLPDTEICRIGIAILKALQTGHALGILHRDVKPANILLAPDHAGNRHARVMITDYGVSLRNNVEQTRLTQGGVIGTPGYTAPERFRDQETSASDIFSLGVTLFAASEGHGPFERATPAASFSAALMDEPGAVERARPELREAIAGMLNKDPERRTDSATAITRLEQAEAAARTATRSPTGHLTGQTGGAAASAPRLGTMQEYGKGGPPYAPVPAGPVPPQPSMGPPGSFPPVQPTGQLRTAGGNAKRVRLGGRTKILVIGLICATVLLGTLAATTDIFFRDKGKDSNSDVAGPSRDASKHPKQPSSSNSSSPGPGSSGEFSADDYPYGKDISLGDPLSAGDCLGVDWPDEPYQGTPELTFMDDCDDGDTDGQVVATTNVKGRAAAGKDCEKRTAELRQSLAAEFLYTVYPSTEGQHNTADTACLVLQHDAPTRGALGKYREVGDEVATTQLSNGDCINTTEDEDEEDYYDIVLADCHQPHHEQVIGFAHIRESEPTDDANTPCEDKYEGSWPHSDDYEVTGWTPFESDWADGFREATCTLASVDQSKLPAGSIKPLY